MAFFGLAGKLGGDSTIAKKIASTASHRGINADGVFAAIGRPSMRGIRGGRSLTAMQYRNSGIRRVAGIGTVLGANAMLGPNGSRSTARNGIQPRSTGGYA